MKNGMPKGIVQDKTEILDVKKVLDAYSNIPANLGVGSKNLSETGSYIMERFTWDYWTLQILFRNNWIAKTIIEKPANEMLKNGFEIQTQLDPEKITKVMRTWIKTKTSDKFLECLKWARLFGGCLLIPMIEGQEDLKEPLDYDDIDVDSYKGCFLVDRWSGVSPSLEVVKDIEDPEFGSPEYYDVDFKTGDKSIRIHHSRVIKIIGRQLPFWEEVAENYWGASELEHVFTELKKRDDTSANIAFLIFLANIRVFKLGDLGQMLTLGDQEAVEKVYQTMRNMNRLMCNTGTFAIDAEDDFTMQGYSFVGINDIYESFMLDIAGAAEIPVDKLFGRSPAGFNDGSETLQNYYDTIQEKQETYLRMPLEKLMKILMMSTLGEIPDDFEIVFNPVRRASDMEKSDLAAKNAAVIYDGFNNGIFGKGTVLRELKAQSKATGLFTNITDEMIKEADEEDKKKKEEEEQEQNELEMGMNEALENKQENEQNDKKEVYRDKLV